MVFSYFRRNNYSPTKKKHDDEIKAALAEKELFTLLLLRSSTSTSNNHAAVYEHQKDDTKIGTNKKKKKMKKKNIKKKINTTISKPSLSLSLTLHRISSILEEYPYMIHITDIFGYTPFHLLCCSMNRLILIVTNNNTTITGINNDDDSNNNNHDDLSSSSLSLLRSLYQFMLLISKQQYIKHEQLIYEQKQIHIQQHDVATISDGGCTIVAQHKEVNTTATSTTMTIHTNSNENYNNRNDNHNSSYDVIHDNTGIDEESNTSTITIIPYVLKHSTVDGLTPLHILCHNVGSILLSSLSVSIQHQNNCNNFMNQTILLLIDMIKCMILYYPDSLCTSELLYNNIPFHELCISTLLQYVPLSIIIILIQHYPKSLRTTNKYGNIPLHYAIQQKQKHYNQYDDQHQQHIMNQQHIKQMQQQQKQHEHEQKQNQYKQHEQEQQIEQEQQGQRATKRTRARATI